MGCEVVGGLVNHWCVCVREGGGEYVERVCGGREGKRQLQLELVFRLSLMWIHCSAL